MMPMNALTRCARIALPAAGLAALVLVAGCSKEAPKAAARPPAEVTTMTIVPRDVPIVADYIAQTQSSQQVNIQARVSGFLDKRVYTEGSVVKNGQVLFQMDQKPFQAQVDAAAAALQRNQAAAEVARANLARTKPLAEQNALSQKDLDDAQGQYEQTAAAVEQSKAQLESAKLELGYTTITSPVDGITSFAVVAEGTYVNVQNSQLTTVAVLSPMWVNLSISENEMQRVRDEVASGRLKMPADSKFTVEIELVDGTMFPHKGRITFADPSYNAQTGTFLLRASVDNPQGLLRPNQYVRARLTGASRPNAILIPQRAVQQGAKGHFAWVINKDSQAELRPITVGNWYGESWFIQAGLNPGDQLVVDGGIRLAPGSAVKASPYVPKVEATTSRGPTAAPPLAMESKVRAPLLGTTPAAPAGTAPALTPPAAAPAGAAPAAK
jgi:membrane fusion protein (multidrug efflux system)